MVDCVVIFGGFVFCVFDGVDAAATPDGVDAAAIPDGGTPSLLLLGDQSYAEFKCLLAVLREDSLVTDLTSIAVNARDMIAAVILYL